MINKTLSPETEGCLGIIARKCILLWLYDMLQFAQQQYFHPHHSFQRVISTTTNHCSRNMAYITIIIMTM